MFLQLYKNFWQVLMVVYTNIIFFTWERSRYFSHDKGFFDHPFVQEGLKRKWLFSSELKALKVRKDLFVIEYPHPMCFSTGGQWFCSKKSHAGVFMSAGLYDLDHKAYEFLFFHELSHVLRNDVFCKAFVSLLGAVLMGGLSLCFSGLRLFNPVFQFAIVSVLTLPMNFIYLGSLWMRMGEYLSDRFAMKRLTVESLEGAVRYLSAVKAYNAELSLKFPQMFTPSGELVRGLHYPKLSKRIQNIQNEILKRKGSFYQPKQDGILSHMQLLKHNDAIQAQVLASL